MNIQDAFINALCENANKKITEADNNMKLNESASIADYRAICIKEKESNYTLAVVMLNKKHSVEEFEDYFAQLRTEERMATGDDDIEAVISKLASSHNDYDYYILSGKDNIDTLYV